MISADRADFSLPRYTTPGYDCLSDHLYEPQRWVKFNTGPWHKLHPLCKTRYTMKTTKVICKVQLEDGVTYLMTFAARPRLGEPVCEKCHGR